MSAPLREDTEGFFADAGVAAGQQNRAPAQIEPLGHLFGGAPVTETTRAFALEHR